jgi:excisionase family DNA binding protein
MNTMIKNRKFMWLVGGIVLALYFAPGFLQSIHKQMGRHQGPVDWTTQTDAPKTPLMAPGISARDTAIHFPSADDPFAKMVGIWGTNVILPVHGLCNIRLELRQDQDNRGQYLGNSTMHCTTFALPSARKVNPMIGYLNATPVSAILAGSVVSGSLHLRVSKTIGEHCAPTEFILTPFGASQLAIEWKDPACGNGEAMLSKGK